jgi:hypothetical protein
MKCGECPLRYVGQMGHTFKVRHKEHIWDIEMNGHNLKFAQHTLDTGHAYGMIGQTTKVLHI